MISYIKKVARAIGLKTLFKSIENTGLRLKGYNLLDPEQTIAFMAPYERRSLDGNPDHLPLIPNCGNPSELIFQEKNGVTDEVFVWEYKNENKPVQLSRYGSPVIGNKVLCIDWNQSSFYKDIWKADQREKIAIPEVIPLFSQFQDGIMYGGYYDFIFLVLTKLCRIKDAFPDEDLSKITIAYPLFNAAYEMEYFRLIGFDDPNLVDTIKFEVTAPRFITGNSAHWHPNKADVLSLKRNAGKYLKGQKTALKRIYISRAGRRCITNEDELISLLKKFDFEIIEDKKRTVIEQIDIYSNASFIIGPHGASFSNIIWCRPGTHLLELFSPNYAPDFFLYLANMMEMKYSAYWEGAPDPQTDYLAGLVEDIHVSIPELEKYLSSIFQSEA